MIKEKIKEKISQIKDKTTIDEGIAYGVTKAKEKTINVHTAVRDKIGGAIVAAFAFVIALVWRDAIKEIVNKVVTKLGIEGSTYIYQIIIAVITTIICVFGIMYFSKWGEKEEKK